MRISAKANASRKVEGVMGGRRISRKRKGNVLGIHECARYDATNRETTGEYVQICEKQPGKNNRRS